MNLKVYYQQDADPALIRMKTVAVLGYGNQGRAHAMNLRDSGCRVIVAQRPGGPNHARAIEDGFEPVSVAEAARRAELLIFALPDEAASGIYFADVSPAIRHGQALGFIHGFAVRFGQILPPPGVDVIMVAPKGPGSLVRTAYEKGGGLACLIAVHQDASENARQLALSWGAAIGGGRGGMIETTFAAECESDLFGEQTVLCGGVIELMKAGYEILVEAGYPKELAYFECIHEVKQIVDLQYAEGMAGMRSRISNTAAYGGLKVGPRLINDAVRSEMRAVLAEIQSGHFARHWTQECAAGKVSLSAMRAAEAAHPSEVIGRRIREMVKAAVPLNAPAKTPADKSGESRTTS